ncbi:hypothetical protein CWE13_00655 [Aliidiomarina shirensis]|uniref:DUF3301 domain-containing protein n=1 Tax=Aliidiomarina shirensis TaxID=1048642 RepID=A0A432WWR8_9GAMM|nr:DUF3301 domain-containing protein [Aliidiomarina shirensis]RUO38195.1 hypothetical protein CWE13_00655 [Aliidiomarina shirensis]
MNASLYDVLALLLLILGGYLFWQWRLQEEHARKQAEAICKKYNVQFLDIARSHGRPRFTPRTGWEAGFQFGFSSDIQTRYEGELVLLNLHLRDVTMPPHKAPAIDDEDAIDGETVTATASGPGSQASEQNKPKQPGVSPSTGAHQIPAPVTTFNVSYGDRQPLETTAKNNNENDLPPIIDAIFPEDLAAHETDNDHSEPAPISIDGFSNTDG